MRRISGDLDLNIQVLKKDNFQLTQASIRKTVVQIASKITNTLMRNLLFTREIRLVKVLLIERALKINPNLRKRMLEDSNKTKFLPVYKVRMARLFFKRKLGRSWQVLKKCLTKSNSSKERRSRQTFNLGSTHTRRFLTHLFSVPLIASTITSTTTKMISGSHL